MQIYCPKCDTGYEIDEALIQDKSRKVKCSNCGEIFEAGRLVSKSFENIAGDVEEDAFGVLAAAMKDDVRDDTSSDNDIISDNVIGDVVKENVSEVEIPTDEKISGVGTDNEETENVSGDDNLTDEEAEVNLENIFERLSEHTERLIESEKKLPVYEKIWFQVKNILGFHFKIKWSFIFIGLMVFVMLSLYNNRYDVVRSVPFMNGVYKFLGIRAKIPGEGLEFQNISWNFIADKDVTKLEIKGFINNFTRKAIEVPVIHIEILDKGTALLQSQNRELKETVIEPNTKLPLNLVVERPAPTAKYVYLTFIDKD